MSEFNVGVCKDNEVIKEIFKEYSQIKGAESCFVSFDKELSDLDGYYKGGALLLNILWICFSGIELAIANAVIGCIFCITIIGIPFGKQFFKIARVALFPFGAKVVRVHY